MEYLNVTEQAAIDEILKFPGVFRLSAPSWIPVPSLRGGHGRPAFDPDGLDDVAADFHESSFDLQCGLQVTERQVPVELCAAAFTGRRD
jgi:hypothetical protein